MRLAFLRWLCAVCYHQFRCIRGVPPQMWPTLKPNKPAHQPSQWQRTEDWVGLKPYFFMTTKIKPITTDDLLDAAIYGKAIDPLRVLAAYADPSNWIQCYISSTHRIIIGVTPAFSPSCMVQPFGHSINHTPSWPIRGFSLC